MKKILLPIIFSCISITTLIAQERYVDEVFTNFTQQNNVLYSQNYSVIAASQGIPYVPTGASPQVPALVFDLYEPAGDTVAERPLIIMLHTGTFLPIIYNGNPTGMRNDVATTNICKSYAKRGYVVANLEYRLGWNPTAATQADRAASLMKAVYRAIQDTKSAVRFFRKDYANGNQYGIDTSRIILCGQGSGGWIALGYATVDKLAEIQLPKFLDANAIPLIDTAVIGDWDGIGGIYNMESNLGYSNDIHMVCSMGGGMGDLSWLKAGDVPMCAVHCPTDPVATYTTGDVSIASIGLVTTDISGSYDVMKKANLLGNNAILNVTNTCTDTYTTAAAAASANAQGMAIANATLPENQTVGAPVDNVFPFITVNPYEASPWDFWDSTTTVNIALAMGLPAAQGTAAHNSNIAQNPDMSYSKSMAYIDSTLDYFCRRIVRVTNLNGAIATNVSACDSYSANGQTYTTSGTYSGITENCDSYIINLTITPSTTNTTAASACDSYEWNGTTYTASGIYTGTTENCVTQALNLTITPSSTNTTTVNTCESYTWNGQTYDTSGIYTGTTTNCVTETLDLTVTPGSTNTTTISACGTYSWNGTTYTASGTYTGDTTNCGVELLNLTIVPSSINTTTISECDSYIWNGQTYTTSGTYTGTTTNCVTESLNLTINVTPAAAVVTLLDGTLTATGGGAGLGVWVDCATQQPFMETAGIPTFTPTANGVYTYVVIDATMSCYGIGNCVQVNNVSLDENDEVLFSIAPNPSNGIFTLKNPSLIDGVIVITDGSGRIIYESSLDASEKSIDISNASLGIYYLNIKSENNNKVIRIIKN
ncbi:MAG: T9SS C-terminal target domain-containing protein [Flavobacteriales bacterium]|nr:T9SS C-terminal target domain-containing protein [Flavobacteriales bacterium]